MSAATTAVTAAAIAGAIGTIGVAATAIGTTGTAASTTEPPGRPPYRFRPFPLFSSVATGSASWKRR